ncbi:MAG: hypothetical protein ACXAC8_15960 [Candidatus Hodarchaeales archaeon]
MKILIFLHGTTIMHAGALGCIREERVKQVLKRESSVNDFISYVPVGNAVKKLQIWNKQGGEICYLSSHKKIEDINNDKFVLHKHNFTEGQIFFRQGSEEYKDIAEKVLPDILIEDDCESIGGTKEMTISNISPKIKAKIKSIIVKEFEGVDHLPDNLSDLQNYFPNNKDSI